MPLRLSKVVLSSSKTKGALQQLETPTPSTLSTMAEKGIRYDDENTVQQYEDIHAVGERKGSIYQVVPSGERRMSAQGRRISVVDDIFGEIKEGGPNYRNVITPNAATLKKS